VVIHFNINHKSLSLLSTIIISLNHMKQDSHYHHHHHHRNICERRMIVIKY
jgi:hypothetical protein